MYRIRNILSGLPSWVLSLLTTLVILWLTLMPDPLGDNTPILFPGADKVVHALMFGFLTVMILTDFSRKRGWRAAGRKTVAASALFSSLMGILIEVLQKVMDLGRGFEIADMMADITGAVICGECWLIFQRYWCDTTD